MWLIGCARLPKVELHLHLEGTIQPETLLELSRRHDAEPLTPEAAKKLYVYENFLGFYGLVQGGFGAVEGAGRL